MIGIAAFEFISRGMLWFRVFLVGLLMPAADFGVLILIISAEAIAGTFLGAPQIKAVYRNGFLARAGIKNSIRLGLGACAVLFAAGTYVTEDLRIAASISCAAAFFALWQVGLAEIRQRDLANYNKTKLGSIVAGTAVFAVLHDQPHLYAAVPFAQFMTVLPKVRLSRSAQDLPKGWGFYVASHAALSQGNRIGMRFAVALLLGVPQVSAFSLNYMIAGGVVFYFSAVMIRFEPDLSRVFSWGSFAVKYRTARAALTWLLGGWVAYTVLFLALSTWLPDFFSLSVFALFSMCFAGYACCLVLQPLLLAMDQSAAIVMWTAVSSAFQVALIIMFLPTFSIEHAALSMTAASWVQATGMLYTLGRRHRCARC